MHNFQKIRSTVDTEFILRELNSAMEAGLIPANFGATTLNKDQQKMADLGSHPESGWVRIQSTFSFGHPEYQLEHNRNSRFLYRAELYNKFPKTIRYLNQIAEERSAVLQRVVLVLLLPDGEVTPHKDIGEYYKYRDRHHLVLKSEKGSEFTSGDEKQIFREGELWWFANKEIHSVKNLSSSDRIHIIFDTLPKTHYSFSQKITNAVLRQLFQMYYDLFGSEDFTQLIEKSPSIRKLFLT